MILPEFFDVAYTMAGNNNVLADFLVNVLRQDEERGEYLYFRVSEVLQIQNLLENMISMTTLDYIEQQYRTATLTELCAKLNLPMHVLSKMIKKNTGFNFKELRRTGVFIGEYFL